MMGTVLFRNIVTPACREIPDRPEILSLRSKAGLYLLEDIWLIAYAVLLNKKQFAFNGSYSLS